MFCAENGYARKNQKNPEGGRKEINLDSQRHWRVDEVSDADVVGLPSRSIYAQNNAYLEICNPGWDLQWRAGLGIFFYCSTRNIYFLLMVWHGAASIFLW